LKNQKFESRRRLARQSDCGENSLSWLHGVLEVQPITVSQKVFKEFVAAIEQPAKPTKALRDLMARPKYWLGK